MGLKLLADLVVLVHAAFIAFVVLGGLLALHWPRAAWLHLPAAAWGAWIEFSGRICPLTPLEVKLRQAAGEAGYEGGFIEHYLLPILYPAELDRTLQLLLGGTVVVINLVVYALVLWRRRQRPAAKAPP